MGDLKFLEVDNRLILPVNYFLHFVLSSSDVIHSWALPGFFIKLDVLSGVITIFDFFLIYLVCFLGSVLRFVELIILLYLLWLS
jgi:hypothetical protein